MAKLWGQDVGEVGEVEGSNKAPSTPSTPPEKLSKKCRLLLEIACQIGRVQPRGNGYHFNQLVGWGFLHEDGYPLKEGRDWYEQNKT